MHNMQHPQQVVSSELESDREVLQKYLNISDTLEKQHGLFLYIHTYEIGNTNTLDT